jgi:uncharacterized DUF497 family protein
VSYRFFCQIAREKSAVTSHFHIAAIDIYAYCAYNLDSKMKFQFDPAKAKSNFKKHNVSFADAEGVFYDPLAIHMEDPDSMQEERWIAVGMSSANQLLVVVYTFRGEEIRLISARQATAHEVKVYEG